MVEQNLNIGHREKLRERLLKCGYHSLTGDEILELCLFLSVPRSDVKPIAKLLIKRYGTVKKACERPVSELLTINGLGERSVATLKTVYAVALALSDPQQAKGSFLNNTDQLLRYIRLQLVPSDKENLLCFYLNSQNQVLFEELTSVHRQDQIIICPKHVIKTALNLSAEKVFLAHNHPNGLCRPSLADIQFTTNLSKILTSLEIELIEHLIITDTDYYSFKESLPLDAAS